MTPYRRLTVGLGAVVLGCALAAGCGGGRPPVADGAGAGPAPISGGDQFGGSDAGSAPPGCGTKADGTTCACVDVPLFVDPPTIYFVLDRSGSMTDDDKWTTVRVTVGEIMRSLGPRANFGAAMFPGPSQNPNDSCTPGTEIMPVRPGDPPSSTDGPTTTALLTLTRGAPGGGTPTGATLELVRTRIATLSGKTYVIVATDGAPNCNPNATCGYDQCQANIEDTPGCPAIGPNNCCEPPDGFRENCNDSVSTLGAIRSLKTSGTPVYVVGLPGTRAGAYASLLDQMAVEGGTARTTSPRYFDINAASKDAMLTALKKIAAQITGTCSFDLKEPPANPDHVNVYLDDVLLPYEPVNGWTIDGQTVTLVGSACERAKSGDVLGVRIIAGCPRIEPH